MYRGPAKAVFSGVVAGRIVSGFFIPVRNRRLPDRHITDSSFVKQTAENCERPRPGSVRPACRIEHDRRRLASATNGDTQGSLRI